MNQNYNRLEYQLQDAFKHLRIDRINNKGGSSV